MGNFKKKYDDSISSAGVYSELNFANDEFQEMNDLKEKKILLKGIIYFFIPVCLFGILAMFFPIVYAIFPVQESEICVCSFFEMQNDGD